MSRRSLSASVIVACAVVASCGGGGGGGGAERAGGDRVDPASCPVAALPADGQPVEIDFWHAMTASNEETLQALVDQYNGSQDAVRVKLVFQGSYDETREKYLAALRGGSLPHVVQMEETATQLMIDSRSVLPAEACVEAADYDLSDHLDRVVAQFRVDGVLWPMPFNVSSPVLYYDKASLERAQVDPDAPPATIEDLHKISRSIVEGEGARHGFVFANSAWNYEQWLALAGEPVVNNGNGRDARATEAVFATNTGVAIVAELQEMLADGTGLSVGANTSGIDNLLALGNNDAAMTVETSAALGSIIAVLEAGQYPNVRLGVGRFPAPADSDGAVVVGGAALWLVDRSADAEKAAAWDFVRWLNEPEQTATWSIGTGYIPIRRSAVDLPVVQQRWQQYPEFRVAFDQLLDAPEGAVAGPVVGAYADLRRAIVEAMERVYLQGAEPAAALEEAERSATEAIQRYNDRVT